MQTNIIFQFLCCMIPCCLHYYMDGALVFVCVYIYSVNALTGFLWLILLIDIICEEVLAMELLFWALLRTPLLHLCNFSIWQNGNYNHWLLSANMWSVNFSSAPSQHEWDGGHAYFPNFRNKYILDMFNLVNGDHFLLASSLRNKYLLNHFNLKSVTIFFFSLSISIYSQVEQPIYF